MRRRPPLLLAPGRPGGGAGHPGAAGGRRAGHGRTALASLLAVTAALAGCASTAAESAPTRPPSPTAETGAAEVRAASANPGGSARPGDPTQPGPYQVGFVEARLVDRSRDDRRIPLAVWYPVDHRTLGPLAHYEIVPGYELPTRGVLDGVPAAEGRHPVIVFSHGSGSSRHLSFFLTELLASHGFIVVAPDHLGNTYFSAGDADGVARSAQQRPKDARFVLDVVLGDPAAGDPALDVLAGHVDRARVGMAGHSYGGYTALAAAGGTQYGDAPDPRVRAVAGLAPWSTQLTDEHLSAVRVPLLLVGATLDETTPVEPNVHRPFELAASAEKYRVDIAGADHGSFTIICATDALLDHPAIDVDARQWAHDRFMRQCRPDVLPPDRSEAVIDRYTVAFFRVHLQGDAAYRSYLTPIEGVTFATG